MKTFNLNNGEEYTCKFNWPPECKLQANENGLVVSNKDKSYRTAFFEAFPSKPKTFIRGEGESVEEAEKSAWEQLQNYINCHNHEFERNGYTNGCGVCKHCGLFQCEVFDIITQCSVCGIATNYISDINNNYYCEEHIHSVPDEKIPDLFGNFIGDSIISKRRFRIKRLNEIETRVDKPIIKSAMKALFKDYYQNYIHSTNIQTPLTDFNLDYFDTYFGFFSFNLESNMELLHHRYLEHSISTLNGEDVYIITFDMRDLKIKNSKYVFISTRKILHFFCDDKDFAQNIINSKKKELEQQYNT